jgi:hypothetical protein
LGFSLSSQENGKTTLTGLVMEYSRRAQREAQKAQNVLKHYCFLHQSKYKNDCSLSPKKKNGPEKNSNIFRCTKNMK